MMTVETVIEQLGGPSEAAKKLGLKRTTVAMWRNRAAVPPRHALRVAEALKVDPATVLRASEAEGAR